MGKIDFEDEKKEEGYFSAEWVLHGYWNVNVLYNKIFSGKREL